MSAKILSDRAIMGAYYARLEQGPQNYVGQLSFDVDSSQDSETHAWIGMPPAMREWVGGKQAKGFNDFDFTIENKDYESTIEYHERELTEDKTGQFQVRLNEHTGRIDQQWAKLTSNLIINGASALCYDGQYYFDTDHSEGDSGTQDNDLTYNVGTPAAPTASEMEQAIMDAVEQMFGFVDDRGEPINENAQSFMVMCPVNMWKAAVTALNAGVIVDGSASRTNMINNLGMNGFNFSLQANARLSATDTFFVFRTDGSVKPFIRQIREQPVVKVLGEGSDHYFATKRKQVSLEMAGAMGYGLWQGAVQQQLT